MNKKVLYNYRLLFTAIITIAIWSLLLWDHYHGGVSSHHLLHRKDLPSISNWWSGLLLPLISWFLLYRIQKRVFPNKAGGTELNKILKALLFGFIAALCHGALLSILFTYDVSSIPRYLLFGILVVALFYPVYYSECVLGFILGMTVTFGVFIPTVVAAIFSLLSLVIYRFVRPAILFLCSKLTSKKQTNK